MQGMTARGWVLRTRPGKGDEMNKELEAAIETLEKDLTGISWQPEVLKDTLCRFSWQSFFPDLPADEFADAVFSRKADE